MAIRTGKYFDHGEGQRSGGELLRTIGWHPDPTVMFKAPSRAKAGALHNAATKSATDRQGVGRLIDEALLAARIEHFIAIGGEKARDYFLGGECPLDQKKIARLS